MNIIIVVMGVMEEVAETEQFSLVRQGLHPVGDNNSNRLIKKPVVIDDFRGKTIVIQKNYCR